MSSNKILINPFSTGGGGYHFEAHVQASFVLLMLTGGYASCLPSWPIVEIKFQGKIDGFNTDDLIVFVEKPETKERWKLLGQIKHSIAITQSSTTFGDVIQAAWNDFNNPHIFTKNKDVIALLTGPLSATDLKSVPWLLNQAKHTKNVNEFLRNVKQANFSPQKSSEKLAVIQHHLKVANGNNDVSDDELYHFLNHFHLLSYDLGNESDVVLSLLHSHISQFKVRDPLWAWSRIVDIVQTWNQEAGTITLDKLPSDLRDAFKQQVVVKMPEEFKAVQDKPKTDWTSHTDATYLALAILIGSWNDKNQHDLNVISQLLGISYDEWLKKAREILNSPTSPLSLKNGIWEVLNRAELWNILGSRILDRDLNNFKSLAIEVLKEQDPAFELPPEKRYAASIHGKVLKYSHALRKSIAEGLAILGSYPKVCNNCSQGKTEQTCVLIIDELLSNADWILWGSLNDLLPLFAEAAPDKFLDIVEKAMHQKPCPFDDLFAQEGNSVFGRNYLTGLLWALEGLAWDDQYLVRVCVVLAELASHDPGGQWGNRPFNSLVTILLPWYPQTLAPFEKRKVAVQTILREWPDIAWKLIIQFLPYQHLTSFGSYKPIWRKTIPDDWKNEVTHKEYWQQVSLYAELAVKAAGYDTKRLSTLIDHFDSLPKPAFVQLLQVLASQAISELPEEQRLLIWDHLKKFTNKHRRFADAEWALPDELITSIENIAEQLAPIDPVYLYKHLFTDRDFDLYEEKGDWKVQQEKLDLKRENAISVIFQRDGIAGVIRFTESVSSPDKVGRALGVIDNNVIEQTLLPHFLNSSEQKNKALVSGFIWRRYHLKGWEWCDNLDKSDWTPEQVGQFLACLPFIKETWDRASKWLQFHEREYWSRTAANAYEAGNDLAIGIEKLIEYGRPSAAISCLYCMLSANQPIDSKQCVQALLSALSSNEPSYAIDSYFIIELIKYLQTDLSVNEDDLFKVEWAYLPLLDRDNSASPKLLENKLANDPEFFCEIMRIIYRSEKENQSPRETSEKSKAIAINAWHLLDAWKTPPGTQKDGTFSNERFSEWLKNVKEECMKSGHLKVALIHTGQVLFYAPPDPDGLWIHRAVAEVLNDREAYDIREGYRIEAYKSRGVYTIDPTGEPERLLARQFRSKAEEVENAGFQRLADTLRRLADNYRSEAEQILAEHKQELHNIENTPGGTL